MVGENFDSIARDPTKDVFVMFSAPWCQECQDMMPVIDELGEHYKSNENLIIAKIDETANEVSEVDIDSYPTFMFFPQGKN